MSDWSVDPDRVMGCLATLDGWGVRLEPAVTTMSASITNGTTGLVIEGRHYLSNAWEIFWQDRRNVPGALMRLIRDSASTVSAITVEVVTGDETMRGDLSRFAIPDKAPTGPTPSPQPGPAPYPVDTWGAKDSGSQGSGNGNG